jgi:mono/diheme cytochrome c family protein
MYKIKLLLASVIVTAVLYSCGSDQPKTGNENAQTPSNTSAASDDSKGVGKFTSVELTHPLDQKLVASGKSIYDVKCNACHKLTDEKLVGPGWKGVTDRRKPEWIMNFVTNTDEMLDKDENAKALMEVCMVRMPNQHLSDEEARAMLEFMRNNDGKN